MVVLCSHLQFWPRREYLRLALGVVGGSSGDPNRHHGLPEKPKVEDDAGTGVSTPLLWKRAGPSCEWVKNDCDEIDIYKSQLDAARVLYRAAFLGKHSDTN